MTPSTLFLSHATPEDNDFTRWLAGKLILAGYTVWYDLDRLKGGDYFWKKIESAIRNDSIRLIAIVSNVSHKKDGVRNEWELGMTIEKQIPGFVIPVRIDGFDFSQLPITIHRKNVIDFSAAGTMVSRSCWTRCRMQESQSSLISMPVRRKRGCRRCQKGLSIGPSGKRRSNPIGCRSSRFLQRSRPLASWGMHGVSPSRRPTVSCHGSNMAIRSLASRPARRWWICSKTQSCYAR